MVRSTTNGVLKSYRYNLQRTTTSLNNSRETVLTGRTFNSFAEDPAKAAQCFQLRRSLLRTDSQYQVGESVIRKYEVAWSTLDTVIGDVNNTKGDSALTSIIRGTSDTTGAGRNALGQQLRQVAQGIVQAMNTKYGDNFVFAGADGLNAPLELTPDGTLKYRGIDVNSKNADEQAMLDYLANKDNAGEKKFVDLGLGLEEDENGKLIESSASNVAMSAISFLGYGVDKDGDPQNVVSIIDRMGQILENCTPDGKFQDGEKEELNRLFGKFEMAATTLSNKHTELDARASFLKSNQEQLQNNSYTLQEQVLAIEDVDPADAITAYSWAQYCYNAALKVGNSILSESLMDFLQL